MPSTHNIEINFVDKIFPFVQLECKRTIMTQFFFLSALLFDEQWRDEDEHAYAHIVGFCFAPCSEKG